MFNFLGSIVGKIASAVVSVFVAIGIVSSPASVTPQPSEEPIIIETATSAAEIQQEAEKEIDVKAELDALKKQLADEKKKTKDLEKKVVVPQTASIVMPAPVVTPTPAPSTPALQPGEFLMPNGAIVNAQGVIIKAAPASTSDIQATTTPATPPPPPPAPVWPPAEGSTVDMQQSMLSNMNFNNHLTCDQLLSVPPSKKDLCKLYKEKQSQYTWNIIVDL